MGGFSVDISGLELINGDLRNTEAHTTKHLVLKYTISGSDGMMHILIHPSTIRSTANGAGFDARQLETIPTRLVGGGAILQ